jgi:hypothetical protein
MPIDVEWQDERGETLARYDGPLFTRALVERAPPASVCLRFIDPYGNTVFNQQQLPVLVQELETLKSGTRNGQLKVIEALLAFLRPVCDHVHTYVKLIGD